VLRLFVLTTSCIKKLFCSKGAACGHGVTTRNVSCMRSSDGEMVESSFCGPLGQQKPLSWQNCYVSCGPGCTLSEWSPWSHCHGDCQKETIGYETRSRTVISQSPAGTTACTDPLWETRDCRIPPCMIYEWALTANADVICRRADGLVVSECESKNSYTINRVITFKRAIRPMCTAYNV